MSLEDCAAALTHHSNISDIINNHEQLKRLLETKPDPSVFKGKFPTDEDCQLEFLDYGIIPSQEVIDDIENVKTLERLDDLKCDLIFNHKYRQMTSVWYHGVYQNTNLSTLPRSAEKYINSYPVLCAAITLKHHDQVRVLIERKADVDSCQTKYSPLDAAITANDIISLRLLIESKADTTRKTSDDKTIVEAINLSTDGDFRRQAMQLLNPSNETDEVEQLKHTVLLKEQEIQRLYNIIIQYEEQLSTMYTKLAYKQNTLNHLINESFNYSP